MINKKIALGTVQLGLNYGVANRRGQPTPEEAGRILDSAYAQGIELLDTAYAYGNSEEVIGSFMADSGKQFKIVSKLPDVGQAAVKDFLEISLQRLRQDKIYGYLLHKFDNLAEDKKLWAGLRSVREQGLVDKIGLTLYRPAELDYLLEQDIDFELLQLPYSIFDQRFAEYFSLLKQRGVEIHARSVFLQGLFFLERQEINQRFPAASAKMEKLSRISQDLQIPVYGLCLGFALCNQALDKVVVGVDTAEQLKQDLTTLEYADKMQQAYQQLKSLSLNDEEVIIPSRWK